MKKIIVAACALAIAACSGGDSDAGTTDETAAAAPATPVTTDSPLVGSYGGTAEDGAAWTSEIMADGSYQDTVGGEVTETGTWTQVGDQVCFTPSVMDGETATDTCMTLVSVNDDGSLVMKNEAGEETTVPKLAS